MTTGMVGHGFYNRNSAPQMASIDYVLPWLDDALGGMVLADDPPTIGLADFGCTEGRNSIAVMRRLVASLQRRTSRPFLTIHSDLPTNDFSELFVGLRPGGRSVFEGDDVSSAAVAGSMFDRLLPPRSLHLAATFNAIGFLSSHPLSRLPGYILPNGPQRGSEHGAVSAPDREIFAQQASDDIAAFATARAAELVPGGKLLIQVFGAGEERRTCDGIYDALNDALLEVVDAGLLDRTAYEAFYQPVYFRTLEKLVAPLTSGVGGLKDLYDVDRAETDEVPVSFVEELRHGGDAAAYAPGFTNFFRAFTEPVLRVSFAEHPSLDALIDDVYGRAERLVRDDPVAYDFHYVAVAALLTRTGEASPPAPEG